MACVTTYISEITQKTPKHKPRRIKVFLDHDRDEIHIETYLLGKRGADVYGGTATITRDELRKIYFAIEKPEESNSGVPGE